MRNKEYTDTELRRDAMLMLIKHFGHSNTLRFLALQKSGDTDYMAIREKLFEGMSAREVFENAKKFWKDKTKR